MFVTKPAAAEATALMAAAKLVGGGAATADTFVVPALGVVNGGVFGPVLTVTVMSSDRAGHAASNSNA